MTAQQKFWLKVALAVTFPLWFIPAIALSGVALIAHLAWEMVSALVDSVRHDDPTDDGP